MLQLNGPANGISKVDGRQHAHELLYLSCSEVPLQPNPPPVPSVHTLDYIRRSVEQYSPPLNKSLSYASPREGLDSNNQAVALCSKDLKAKSVVDS